MTGLVLHHFDISPFAEKVRKLFGVKSLAWKSVQIPIVTPKPDLYALTGGYRKTPVLQIGADIFCDTRLIVETVERLHPSPPVIGAEPLVMLGLQHWSDAVFFPPGAGLSLYENREHIPDALMNDRRDYFSFLDFDRFETDAPHFRSQVRAHARLIEIQLGDGRPYLTGPTPVWADIGAYFNIWMARANFPSSARLLADMPFLLAWRDRMDALGEGARTEISATDAIDIAHASAPGPVGASLKDESGATPGDPVIVAAADHGKDPVAGDLVLASDREIVIARRDPRAGLVHVHFPRIGFRLEPAAP